MNEKVFKTLAILSGVAFLFFAALMPTAVGMSKCADPVKDRIDNLTSPNSQFTHKELCHESLAHYNYLKSCYSVLESEYVISVRLVEKIGELFDKNSLTLTNLKDNHNYTCSIYKDLVIEE